MLSFFCGNHFLIETRTPLFKAHTQFYSLCFEGPSMLLIRPHFIWFTNERIQRIQFASSQRRILDSWLILRILHLGLKEELRVSRGRDTQKEELCTGFHIRLGSAFFIKERNKNMFDMRLGWPLFSMKHRHFYSNILHAFDRTRKPIERL